MNAGSLVGNGTIAGNLVLGTAANLPVTLSPGIFGTSIGTITITQSMQIVSTAAATNIEVTSLGAYDQIVVQGSGGWAILNGNLNVTFDAPLYKPARRTSLTFITAPSFVNPGTSADTDFANKNMTGGHALDDPRHYENHRVEIQ